MTYRLADQGYVLKVFKDVGNIQVTGETVILFDLRDQLMVAFVLTKGMMLERES